jgi:hypothetical protein
MRQRKPSESSEFGPPPNRLGKPALGTAGLSAEQRKRVFADNLNQLLDLIGGGRKDAAEEIGISYRWVRRMVSAGVSRPDERNEGNLQKLARYFALPGVEHLWWPNLVATLVASDDGKPFLKKFGTSVERLVNEHIAQSNRIDQNLVETWKAVHAQAGQEQAAAYEAKLKALFATGRHDALVELDALCKRMVEDAYDREFAQRKTGAG